MDDNNSNTQILDVATSIQNTLKRNEIRCKIDNRSHIRFGSKLFEWERKGVPIRIEIGQKNIDNNTITVVQRHSGIKSDVSLDTVNDKNIHIVMQQMLDKTHQELLEKAQKRLDKYTFHVSTYDEMKKMITSNNTESLGFYCVPWCDDAVNEKFIKDDCKATIRCYPLDLNKSPPIEGVKCFFSGRQASHFAYFARAF
jgi:prolyl-tRNA synthetase